MGPNSRHGWVTWAATIGNASRRNFTACFGSDNTGTTNKLSAISAPPISGKEPGDEPEGVHHPVPGVANDRVDQQHGDGLRPGAWPQAG
jgi:hypothetical protein